MLNKYAACIACFQQAYSSQPPTISLLLLVKWKNKHKSHMKKKDSVCALAIWLSSTALPPDNTQMLMIYKFHLIQSVKTGVTNTDGVLNETHHQEDAWNWTSICAFLLLLLRHLSLQYCDKNRNSCAFVSGIDRYLMAKMCFIYHVLYQSCNVHLFRNKCSTITELNCGFYWSI